MKQSLALLNQCIIQCRRCPRLVEFREHASFRKSEPGWRKPVCGFGDSEAWLFLIGLAPANEGGNRTGRLFTGDLTARFLTKALYNAGFASQPESISKDDGLRYQGCYLSASVKCVPPANLPTAKEVINCSSYLENEILLLKKLKVVIGLGKLAFDSYQSFLIRQGCLNKKLPFSHGALLKVEKWPLLLGSYHPSPQNTNTGRLSEKMFLDLLEKARGLAEQR